LHGTEYMAETAKMQLSASLEDYLEAIYNLAGESEVARSTDIAELLDVSKSSVTGALRLLKEKGLASHEPYGGVTLTDSGRARAQDVVRKHNILKSFFVRVLGIDAGIAQEAACRAEHTLGPEIIARLLAFIEFVTENSKNGDPLAERFKQFCRSRPAGRDRKGED